MIKHDIRNNLRQFTKTLRIYFQLNTTHIDLVTVLNLDRYMSVPNRQLFQIKMFVLLDQISKLYKVV